MSLRGAKKVLRGISLKIEGAAARQLATAKLSLLLRLRDATPVDTGEARDGWRITPGGLENDVDHISALNDGHSPQAEPNFIEHAVMREGLKIRGSIVKEL